MKNGEKTITVPAGGQSLTEVYGLVDGEMEKIKACSRSEQLQMHMVVDEIFGNIISYAYDKNEGLVTLAFAYDADTQTVTITFIDEGRPFDPLSTETPDVTLPPEQRKIGGLGLFMVKNAVDEFHYEYKDGKNISRLTRRLRGNV